MRKVAAELRLSEYRSRRLLICLNRTKAEYKWRSAYESIAELNVVQKELKKFEKLSRRLSGLLGGLRSTRLQATLPAWFDNGGMAWLYNKYAPQMPPASEYATARAFIGNWIEQADTVAEMLKLAGGQLVTFPTLDDIKRSRTVGHWHPSHEWAYGIALPLVYERITGKKFGISKIADQVVETASVKFVISASQVIGFSPVTANTVDSFVSAARRRRLQG